MAASADKPTTRRKKNVEVFTRILPSVDFSHENIKVEPNSSLINVRCLQDFLRGVSSSHNSPQHANFWCFTTDGIYYNSSQEEIYDAVMHNVVDNLLAGSHVILMCYGQTGAGKSFTINGLRNHYEHRGLAPRLLGELFQVKSKHEEDAVIRYKMSYVEVTGRVMKDLLLVTTPTSDAHVTSSQRVAKNASVVDVASEEDGLKLLFEGESRRNTCGDKGTPYSGSNLGHGILTIHVENTSLLVSEASRITAKVHLLDLAGIDSAGKSTSLWKKPRQIGHANTTKSILQQFLSHLETAEDERLSPVIGYLGKSLSTESLFRLVGHIRATFNDLDITLSTLRLGAKVSGMRATRVKLSTARRRDVMLQTRAAEVAWLRGRVELAAMLENQTDWKQDNLSPDRIEQIHTLARRFIANEVREIKVKSVMENVIVMEDFKEAYAKTRQTKAELDRKYAVLAEEAAELAREKSLLENTGREKSSSAKLSKGTSSTTGSLGRSRGKKVSSKALQEQAKDPVEEDTSPPQPPVPELVGTLRNRGITIGPGFVSNYEGEATKASKRNVKAHQQLLPTKERDKATTSLPDKNVASSSLSLREQFRCAQEFSSDSEGETRNPMWTPITVSPNATHDEAWEEFLASGCPYAAEIRADLERERSETETALRKHVQTCAEMREMDVTLARVLHELINEQHQRHLAGRDEYDVDGKILVGENERNLVAQSKQLETEMGSKRETLLQGLDELNECLAKLRDVNKKLEDNFEEFRAQSLNTSPTDTEVRNKQLEITSRRDPVAENRSKTYQSLQKLNFSMNDCKVQALS